MIEMREGFFPLDHTWYTSEILRYWFIGRSNGIINYYGDDYGVKAAGGMNITVKPGFAYMATGTDTPGGGMCFSLDPKTIKVEVADDFTRYDYIALEYDERTNEGKPKYYKGTRELPVPKRDVNTFQLIVAIIEVKANTAAISDLQIQDTRMNEEYCGLAIDKLASIPTAGYDRQFQAFMGTIKNILNAETAGNLYNLIETKQNKVLDGIGAPGQDLGEDEDIYLELEG